MRLKPLLLTICISVLPGSWLIPAQAQSTATPPQIRVTLSSPTYHIQIDPRTSAPYMPKNVVAKAEVVGLPAGVTPPKEFTWRVMLDWNHPVYPTSHSLKNRTFAHGSPFRVDFGDEIRGGTLKVFAKATIDGQDISGSALAQVVGSNPPKKAVYRLLPRNKTGLLLAKLATVESGVRQFTVPDGQPKESVTHDFGVMQLNAPSGAITGESQIWDWRDNVRRGVEMFTGKRRTSVLASRNAAQLTAQEDLPQSAALTLGLLNIARTLLDKPQIAPPTIPLLSELPGSGIEAGETDRDKLNLTQIERDAIRRYNGGREYTYVLTPDATTLDIVTAQWQVDPTRGGIALKSGDPNYVRKVIEADSGFVIPPPPKPLRRTKQHAIAPVNAVSRC